MLSDWRSYGHWGYYDDIYSEAYTGKDSKALKVVEDIKNEYISSLKTTASSLGISPDNIDSLIDEGFTLDEIEEYIYGCAM